MLVTLFVVLGLTLTINQINCNANVDFDTKDSYFCEEQIQFPLPDKTNNLTLSYFTTNNGQLNLKPPITWIPEQNTAKFTHQLFDTSIKFFPTLIRFYYFFEKNMLEVRTLHKDPLTYPVSITTSTGLTILYNGTCVVPNK